MHVTSAGEQRLLEWLADWQAPLRAQFPIIVAHPELVYLDSAATAQKPQAVLDAALTYLTTSNANAGRGTYPWANRTTELLERTRGRVKRFLGDPAPERSRVDFFSGATEGLRSVALDWLPRLLADGDEIIVPFGDHQANLLPWLEAQKLLAERGVHITVRELPCQAGSHDYDTEALARLAGPRTRFVAVTHVHHVYGADMNIHRVRAAVGPDVPICLDAAQSVGHLPLSLAELDVDLLVFSGHKTLALPGTGAVWSREARGPGFAPSGWRGTPNTVGVASLERALDWLDAADVGRVGEWTSALSARLTEGLRHLGQYEVLGCGRSLAADSEVQRRAGIVTFRHELIDSMDLGFILYSHGFMVRSDDHCQGYAGERDPSVRVSPHVYNTPEEIDRLLEVLAEL
ncbi:aminotransferase class V-fold PLP-dependent enzyme [Streptomyces tsukubensis]|uniref:Cysteine desulfurase n=1 Tax=Streptomyces tsukubensis TaxID=83656 RepID=A0A1V4ABM0_9ACTN|nr:aminotransferase class V-fold PLP-dependent enzyme [Streptomyces tsukubensis]OON80671.1 cysteine desulfurase [Streptomyces tsukubensis]QFR96335.1 aminotransferase class V-fold PLP-dependent enzyme [Streptomyces tsukubensis]